MASLASLAAVLTLCAPTQDEWTWCVGELSDPEQQGAFVAQVEQLYGYYQDRSLLTGPRVAANELGEAPAGRAVFFGPVQAFRHPEWLEPMVELRDGIVHVGGLAFDHPRVAIFVRDPTGERVVFTATRPEAFGDIFTVPTGNAPCTITADGQVVFEGEYRSGPDGPVLHLIPRGFLPALPSAAELAHLEPAADAVAVQPVYAVGDEGAFAAAFGERLRTLTEDRGVLFVGETHWNVGVHRAFGDVLRALLERGELATLFLELNFSFSAHFDHYVGLGDEEAQDFLERELHPFLHLPSTLDFLEILRTWNRDHPERRVSVACHDLEFDPELTLERVIGAVLPDDTPGLTELVREPAAALDALRSAVEREEIRHPFLDRGFLLAVLDNLGDSVGRRSTLERQAALLRNLREFHGQRFGAGLAVFLGGGWHATTAPPGAGEPWTEAAWLQHEFPPTKGRVATLRLAGLGVSFGAAAEVDPSASMRAASNYAEFLRRYREALWARRVTPTAHYRLDGGDLDPIDALVLLHGESTERNVLWLESVDVDRLREARLVDRVHSPYDATVFVLRSELEPLRTRRGDGG